MGDTGLISLGPRLHDEALNWQKIGRLSDIENRQFFSFREINSTSCLMGDIFLDARFSFPGGCVTGPINPCALDNKQSDCLLK